MMWIWENKKCSGFANLENSLVNFILTLLLRRLFILGMSPYFSLSKIVTNHEINSWENKATLAWLQLRLKSEHFSMKYCKEEEFYAERIRKMKPICQCSSKSTDGKMFHPLEGIFLSKMQNCSTREGVGNPSCSPKQNCNT